MEAVKGYINSGRFTPTDGARLPLRAHAMLIIDSVVSKPTIESPLEDEKMARKEWLNQLQQARQLAQDDPLPDFVSRQPMREPHGLTD
jgi:hypothetical protein